MKTRTLSSRLHALRLIIGALGVICLAASTGWAQTAASGGRGGSG